MRWILDFAASGLDDDNDDFLFYATEELEWSHYKAKRRASTSPPPP